MKSFGLIELFISFICFSAYPSHYCAKDSQIPPFHAVPGEHAKLKLQHGLNNDHGKVHGKTPALLFSKIRISNSILMYLEPLVAALGVELEIYLK